MADILDILGAQKEDFDPEETRRRVLYEKTHGLAKYQILPHSFDTFLTRITDQFRRFLLRENDCNSFEELKGKYCWEVRKKHSQKSTKAEFENLKDALGKPDLQLQNPEKEDVKLLQVLITAKMTYDKGPWVRSNAILQDSKHHEWICAPWEEAVPFDDSSYSRLFQSSTTNIGHLLDERFPSREGKLHDTSYFYRPKDHLGDEPIESYLKSFEYNLYLRSDVFPGEVGVSLTTEGSLGPPPAIILPGIRISVERMGGSYASTQKAVNALCEVLRKSYEISTVTSKIEFET